MRCCVIVIVVMVASVGVANAFPTEPSTSWIYPYFEELRLRSGSERFFSGTGPYRRDEMAAYIERIKARGARSYWLKQALMRELRYAVAADSSEDGVIADLLLGSYIQSEKPLAASATMRLTLSSGESLALWSLFRASLNGEAIHKIQTRPWKDNARASIDAGGLSFGHGRLSVFIGRDELSWGIDRRRGLLFSGSAPAFDMIRIRFKATRFLYTMFGSRIRKGRGETWDESIERYVSGHRLEIAPSPWLNFGISEAVLYGGKNRSFEPAYLNPLTILYAEQWNLNEDDNVLISADVAYIVGGRFETRAEIMIDDFQYDFESEPGKYAFGIGITAVNPLSRDGSLLGFSYFQVRPCTYGHKVDYNRFIQEAAMLGYPDGPDTDRFNLWCSFAMASDFLWSLDFSLRRKGMGVLTEAEQGCQTGFLEGVVERQTRLAARLDWHPSDLLKLQADFEWHKTTNLTNIEGKSNSGIEVNLSLTSNINNFLRKGALTR